jgi:hypothetical protein
MVARGVRVLNAPDGAPVRFVREASPTRHSPGGWPEQDSEDSWVATPCAVRQALCGVRIPAPAIGVVACLPEFVMSQYSRQMNHRAILPGTLKD